MGWVFGRPWDDQLGDLPPSGWQRLPGLVLLKSVSWWMLHIEEQTTPSTVAENLCFAVKLCSATASSGSGKGCCTCAICAGQSRL